jgi:hypothetical protein
MMSVSSAWSLTDLVFSMRVCMYLMSSIRSSSRAILVDVLETSAAKSFS